MKKQFYFAITALLIITSCEHHNQPELQTPKGLNSKYVPKLVADSNQVLNMAYIGWGFNTNYCPKAYGEQVTIDKTRNIVLRESFSGECQRDMLFYVENDHEWMILLHVADTTSYYKILRPNETQHAEHHIVAVLRTDRTSSQMDSVSLQRLCYSYEVWKNTDTYGSGWQLKKVIVSFSPDTLDNGVRLEKVRYSDPYDESEAKIITTNNAASTLPAVMPKNGYRILQQMKKSFGIQG